MGEEVPMNFEWVIKEFEGEKEILVEVLNGFLKNVASQIKAIRRAISAGNAELVRKEAHSIKGGAANLSANNLARVAFELEDIAKSGTLERGHEVVDRVEREFHRLEAYAGSALDI